MRTLAALAACFAVPLGAAGCGAERTEPPDLSATAAPAAFVPYAPPGSDVAFPYPSNWALLPQDPPGLITVATGGASLTVWKYDSVAAVRNAAGAASARRRLIASLRRRAPTFKVDGSRVTTVAGHPAVEINGTGEIAGRRVRSRSTHVYAGRTEYVVDAFAAPAEFARLNREVFAKVLAGFEVS